MEWPLIIILAVLQGLTEFLPVSSSGHLVVAGALFEAVRGTKLPADIVEVNILLHAGTLVAVLIYFWRPIFRLLGQDRRVIGLLAVGTLPAVIVGLPIDLWFVDVLKNPLITGVLLLLNGGLLFWVARQGLGETEYQQISYRQALLIGIFQAVAVLPGLSRSGWTISAGLMLGLRREAAAAFSFLLAIPTITGAIVMGSLKLQHGGAKGTPGDMLAVGMVISFLVGLGALWFLIHWLKRGRLRDFAWWCVPVGGAVVIWQILRILLSPSEIA